jgi:hypothetical protein
VYVVYGARGERLAFLLIESPDFGAAQVLEFAVPEGRLEVIIHYALVADERAVGHLLVVH